MDEFRRYKPGRIPTYPKTLEIADIEEISHSPGGLVIIPTYYNCEIFLSIYVMKRIIKWSIRNRYIQLNDILSFPIRHRKDGYNDPTEKENDETQVSPSVSTPNAHGSITS